MWGLVPHALKIANMWSLKTWDVICNNLRAFVDFGLHKKWRTTSAQTCKRAHKRANGHTLKKCSFGFLSYGALQPLDEPFRVFCWNQHESAIHYHTWYIVEHLGSNHCFEWRLGMTSRLHSANTLVEGMNKVGHGSVADRRRALEEQIAVTWLHALIFPSLWPLDRNLYIMGIWFICMVNHFFAPFLRRVVHEWMPYDARRATRLPPSLQKSHQADTC